MSEEQAEIVWRVVGLTVERVRKFQARTSWEFRAPDGTPLDAIIFAGPNGCGKSSLLDAILFGLSDPRTSLKVEELDERSKVQLELEVWEQTDGDYVRKISSKSRAITKAIHHRTTETEKILESIHLATLDDSEDEFENYTLSVGEGIFELLNQTPENIKTKKPHTRYLSTHIAPIISNTGYFSAWRSPKQRGSVRPNLNTSSVSGDDERDRLMRIKSQLVTHLARGMLSRQPEAVAARQSGERWLEQITAFWRAFAASAYSKDVMIGVDEVWTLDGLAYDLFVFDGETRIPVDHLSAGELEILQLAGTLIMRPEGPLQLLIYDEPELHLHQAWQAAWLGAVRKLTPQTQLIIATHSEAIWQRAMSYERFLLVDEDDPRASLDAHKRGRRA